MTGIHRSSRHSASLAAIPFACFRARASGDSRGEDNEGSWRGEGRADAGAGRKGRAPKLWSRRGIRRPHDENPSNPTPFVSGATAPRGIRPK